MRMENGVKNAMRKEIDELSRMPVSQLRQKYLEVFGEASRSNHKQFLFRGIAWRIQANAEGGLSERARRRAGNRERCRPADPVAQGHGRARHNAGPKAQRHPQGGQPPGTYLEREYKGRRVIVKILVDGFEFESHIYRSLSAIASEVTGTKWNGFLFFNLTCTEEKPNGKE